MSEKKEERKRLLKEIITRYKLEPELRDIYVEGASDKSLVQWFANREQVNNVIVYDISTVDVPDEYVAKLNLNSHSNRSRVIALAKYLCENLAPIPVHVTCIADRDFDYLFNNNSHQDNCEVLLFTDYSCMEMYWFDPKVIDKFFNLALNTNNIDAEIVLNSLSSVLVELFLVRAANENLGLGIKVLKNFGNCCGIKNNDIVFDLENYVEKFVNRGGKFAEKDNFLSKINELRNRASSESIDRRYLIHGHDFGELLSWYIKKYIAKNKREFHNQQIVEKFLVTCCELDDLKSHSLFQSLLDRLR